VALAKRRLYSPLRLREGSHVKLPNADSAIIEPAKLRDYLLSPEHPWGRYKAHFFESLGYSQNDWRQLEADLRRQHLPLDTRPGQPSPFGQKFEILASIRGPLGKIAMVLSVWIVRNGESVPRFVTATPG